MLRVELNALPGGIVDHRRDQQLVHASVFDESLHLRQNRRLACRTAQAVAFFTSALPSITASPPAPTPRARL